MWGIPVTSEITRLQKRIAELEAQLAAPAESKDRAALVQMTHMWTEARQRVDAVEAQTADLVRRLLDDHQRVEPHHADQCELCREATAAIGGQPAQGGEIDVAEHMAWIARNVKRQEPAQSNSHQIAVKQPAPGERQPSMIASAVYTASGKVFIGSSEE